MTVTHASRAPTVTRNQFACAAGTWLTIDIGKEVDQVDCKHAPHDYAKKIGIGLEDALERSGQRLAGKEIVIDPEVRKWQKEEIGPEQE